MIFCAALVPKSFSTNVAIAIAPANNIKYRPAALVLKNGRRIFLIFDKAFFIIIAMYTQI
jgi:3-polyprenyl-4-hydroxybenzoate decarboxylase